MANQRFKLEVYGSAASTGKPPFWQSPKVNSSAHFSFGNAVVGMA